jgi:hypothetical protein
MHSRELGSEQKYLRRIVDPNQNDKLSDHEEQRRDDPADPLDSDN